MLPLPCSHVCVGVSSPFCTMVEQGDAGNAGTIWAGMTSSMHFLLYFVSKYLNIMKMFESTYLYPESYASLHQLI